MTGREWGWRPAQAEGIWRHGARWTKPLFAAVPWITLALLLVMFALLGDTLTAAPGVVFDLPAPVGRQAASPDATMLVLADRRVSAGELMRLVGIARESGVRRVQIAERRE